MSAMCHKDVSTDNTKSKDVPDKVASGITDVCFSTGFEESPFLLPVLNIKLRGHSGQSCSFNFLFDTGSQLSYLSSHALAQLGCKQELMSTVDFEVKTFLGSSRKRLKDVNLDVYVRPSRHYGTLLLGDDQFDISFNIKGYGQAVKNFKAIGTNLAAD